MEPLRHDDPRRLGPYFVVGRLDRVMAPVPAPDLRLLARRLGDAETTLVSMPLPEISLDMGYSTRFRAEAEQARRLAPDNSWLEPVVDVAAPDDTPWRASRYLPGLSVAEAVTLHGGPLPELTVCALGAYVAEALEQAHRLGFTHAGVTPATVLLTGETPRLTAFGAVRAAAVDGQDRSTAPGLVSTCTAPEQLTGGRPRPLGDVYALGATLAYAASGRLSPERSEIPGALREVLASCQRHDPADRPGISALAEYFGEMTAAGPRTHQATNNTVLDGAARASSPPAGWLPKRVLAGIAHQAAAVLQAAPELDSDPEVLAASTSYLTPVPSNASPDMSVTSLDGRRTEGITGRPGIASPAPGRRTTRRALVSGAAGTMLGAGGLGILTTFVSEAPPTPRPKSISGVPPVPLWKHRLSGSSPRTVPYLWQNEILVVASTDMATGIDVRNGNKIWKNTGIYATGSPVGVTRDLVVIPDMGSLSLISPRKGTVRWTVSEYGNDIRVERILKKGGGRVWAAMNRGPGDPVSDVVSYDVQAREETWRTALPKNFYFNPVGSGNQTSCEVLPLKGGFAVPEFEIPFEEPKKPTAKRFVAINADDGEKLWTRTFDEISLASEVYSLARGSALHVSGKSLESFALKDGAHHWSVEVDSGAQSWGSPAVHEGNVYVADTLSVVYAFDGETGKVRWKCDPGLHIPEKARENPHVHITSSGRTVLVVSSFGILAHDAEDGRILWHFRDERSELEGIGADPGWIVVFGDGVMYVVSRNIVYAFAVP